MKERKQVEIIHMAGRLIKLWDWLIFGTSIYAIFLNIIYWFWVFEIYIKNRKFHNELISPTYYLLWMLVLVLGINFLLKIKITFKTKLVASTFIISQMTIGYITYQT
jgi:hypothetical protein